MKFFFFATLILIMNVSAFAEDSMGKYLNSADKVSALSEKYDVLMIGENSHDQDQQYTFLTKILNLGVMSHFKYPIYYIGFEISSEYQAVLDSFINGEIQTLPVVSPRIATKKTQAAFVDLLNTIRRFNDLRKMVSLEPIRALALDLPGDCGEGHCEESWFAQRDRYMYEGVKKASQDFSRKGILFLGAGHLAHKKVAMPKLAVKLMKVPAEMDVLGTLITETEGVSSLNVWLDTPITTGDAFAKVPPDWKSIYNVSKGLKNSENRLIKTNSPEFLYAEASTQAPNSAPFRISDNFDYYFRFESDITPIQNCSSLLNPKNLFRGTMMRVLTLF